MELVTGRTGTPHVTSQQDRMLNQGTFGAGTYILNTGQLLEPQVQSSNEIRIRDGAIMVQGALGCIKVNTYDSVTIQNGNQGMQRIDLIVWQYTYDAEQDVESADWVVIQGTPAESDPQQPLYTSGDIQEGDELVQIPVFEVHLDGINVTEVKKLLSVSPDIPTLNAYLSDLSSKMTDIILRKSKTNRINVAAGQRSVSGIILDAIEGYTPLVSLVWSSHSTTITSDCHIDNDRVTFYFDAKSAQTPETFTAETIYVKNTVISNSP